MAVVIGKVREEYGWLGNMAPFPVTRSDWFSEAQPRREWATTEHLFQAMRFNEPKPILAIHRQKSPMAAKMTAKHYADRMVVKPRSKEDVGNMWFVLHLKLDQHPELKVKLLATGDELIVEDCSNRRNDSGLFWGAALVDDQWVGLNTLGKTWMDIRWVLDK